MAKTKPKNPLTRQQKLFRMVSLYPLDANNLDIEEAVSRLFVYLRTSGRQITRTDKVIFTSWPPSRTKLRVSLETSGWSRSAGTAVDISAR